MLFNLLNGCHIAAFLGVIKVRLVV
jgi:hypothetical protein